MVRISVLGDALKTMYNAEKRGKRQVLIRPASKVVIKFLQLMQKHGYISEFEFVDDHRAGKIVVELNGRLNKCGVISPRYDIGHTEMEDWVARLLPSRLFGVIVLTTSAGIMDHETARAKGVGGKVGGWGAGGGGRVGVGEVARRGSEARQWLSATGAGNGVACPWWAARPQQAAGRGQGMWHPSAVALRTAQPDVAAAARVRPAGSRAWPHPWLQP
jgi:small subunit ribosomal protein S15Ae